MKLIKGIMMLLIIPLILITKVINMPITVNFSPADIVLIFLICFGLIEFIANKDYREELVKEKSLYIFLGLIVLRIISSITSYHIGVVTLDYKGAIISNIKFILSFLYVVVGISVIKLTGQRRVFYTIYTSSLIYVVVGLLSQYFFKFAWATTSTRMIALSNDPNVAGLVIILGIIAGFKIMDESSSTCLKLIIWVLFLVLGFGLILTGSRTAILAFVFAMLVLLTSYIKSPKKLILTISIGCLLLSGALFVDNHFLDAKGYEVLINRSVNEIESASEYRKTLTLIANEMGKDHMLLGVGTGNFLLNAPGYYEKMNLEMRKEQVAHNTFFSFYGENGIIATLLYLALIIFLGCRVKNPYGWMYLVVLLTYSIFFNVENIRILWFSYGVYLFSTSESQVSNIGLSNKKMLILVSSCVSLSYLFMPELVLPYAANGQTVRFEVKDQLALYMETRNSEKDTLEILIQGPTNEKITIKNRLGFYYEELNLLPGEYELTIDSTDKSVYIDKFDLITDREYSVVDKLLSFDDLEVVKAFRDRKLDYVDDFYKYDIDVKPFNDYVLYKNDIVGVNFKNEIALISSEYLDNKDDTTTVKLKFKKIGNVTENYVLLFRAYPVNQEEIEIVNQLARNYTFEIPLTELEIGSEFTADWTFHTGEQVYMMYYGFYHKNTEKSRKLRWFREGFVK